MTSSTNLEERFTIAVKTIQNLPSSGIIQPSNLTKLTFYGLYKQATQGPCNVSRPSMFNIVGRAKWDAWDRCRSMTKEQAMSAYIGEISKIIETMPQTNEVLDFAKSMGFSPKSNSESCLHTSEDKEQHQITTDETLQASNTIITQENQKKNQLDNISKPLAIDEAASLSMSSTSSSMSCSDIDEFYDDPAGYTPSSHDDVISDYNIIEQSSCNQNRSSSRIGDNQNRTNTFIRSTSRYNNSHIRTSIVQSSSLHRPNSSNRNINSITSTASDINNRGHPTSDYNKETQRAILTALNKLQRNINNILERLNRLETAAYLLQQKALSTSFESNMASLTTTGDIEHLGIPKAVFVDDVDGFMQQPENDSPDTVIRRLDDLNSKYRFMEMNLLQKKKRLRGKLPDIQICLDMIEQLRKYRENNSDMETNFLLAHNVYGKATMPPTDKVCLWLGANVMLEYTLDEADELLRGNQSIAQRTLQKVNDDLDFLRDQITTTEVNMARLHNWAVKQKQKQQHNRK